MTKNEQLLRGAFRTMDPHAAQEIREAYYKAIEGLMTLAQALANKATLSEPKKALDQLVRTPHSVVDLGVEGIQPPFQTVLHIGQLTGRRGSPHDKQAAAEHEPENPVGRDVEHGEE